MSKVKFYGMLLDINCFFCEYWKGSNLEINDISFRFIVISMKYILVSHKMNYFCT